MYRFARAAVSGGVRCLAIEKALHDPPDAMQRTGTHYTDFIFIYLLCLGESRFVGV